MNKRFIAMMLMLTMNVALGTSGTYVYSAVSEEKIVVSDNASTFNEDLPEDSPDVSIEEELNDEVSDPIEKEQKSEDAENLEDQEQELMDAGQMEEPSMMAEEEEEEEEEKVNGEIKKDTDVIKEDPVPERSEIQSERIYDFVIQGAQNLLQSTMMTDPEWPSPGAIYLEKNARRIEDNSWEMELIIRGKDFISTNDIAIVIDNANTLNSYLPIIKEAAKKFGDTLLTEGAPTRIRLVTYGDYGIESTEYYTYSELPAYKNYIDLIKQDMGSGASRNLQALVHEADRALYENDSQNQKNMVVLGSSAPTLSFPFVATGNLTGCELGEHKKKPTVFDEDIVITGDFLPDYTKTIFTITGENKFSIKNNAFVDVTCQEHGKTESYPFGTWAYDSAGNLVLTKGATGTDNGFGAIWEARESINKGTNIFTIAFDDDADLVDVLRKMASSSSNYYRVASKSSLDAAVAAFDIIASLVSIAAKNGTVTDPMGELVDLEFRGDAPTYTTVLSDYESGDAEIYISQGSLTYFSLTETISWKAGNINEGQDAVMKYRIRLEEGTEVEKGDVILPNGTTTFSYRNYNDAPTDKNFDVPEITVGGETIQIHYYRVNESGEPVNSVGTVVPLVNAQRLDSETHTSVYGTYEFTAKDIENYIYFGYVLSNIQTPDTKTVRIITSEVTGSQTLWFGYYPGKTSLKITKVGSEDPEQNFIFHIEGDEIDLKITIKGNGSLIIKDLPVGQYTVTELIKWSWRYQPVEESKTVIALPKTTREVVFENTRTFGKWLSGDSWIRNIFTAWMN